MHIHLLKKCFFKEEKRRICRNEHRCAQGNVHPTWQVGFNGCSAHIGLEQLAQVSIREEAREH